MLFLTPHILWEDSDVDHFMKMNKDRMLWYKKRHGISDEDIDIDPFPDYPSEPIYVPPSMGALNVEVLAPEEEDTAAPPPQDQSAGEEEPMEFPDGQGTESE